MKKISSSLHPCKTILNAVALIALGLGAAGAQQLSTDPSTWLPAQNSQSLNLKSLSLPTLPLQPKNETQAEPSYHYTFQELGANYPFTLKGIDGSDSLFFNIRADEIVTKAEVDLIYSYSPALLSEYSHINVLVNEEVAHSIPVPRDQAGRTLNTRLDLPAHLFTEFNQLRFQLIGHYTLECEDPLHSSLWASISNKSTLSVDVKNIPLSNELSKLPLPFFDHRDTRHLSLPFVFINDRSEPSFEAAGMVASWFGILTSYRGASFPAHMDGSFPQKGNAIVFMKSDNSANLPSVSGPTLAITANPNDPAGKLLWVMGRDPQEIKLAAIALVTGANTLSGQAATIQNIKQIEPRKPYDAPYWVPTDRPVKFGELVPLAKLNSIGYYGNPVRIPLRLPPDLFGWNADPVPLTLKFRYSVQPGKTDSSLIVSANRQFMRSFNLLSADEIPDQSWTQKLDDQSMLPIVASMKLPLDTLLQEQELEFRFMFDYIKEGSCRDIIVDNVRGRIDPDSTIDFSSYPHFMPLPDLQAFGNSGFPFTRLADLSETAVVLNSSPSPQEVSTYLALMGRFGDSTGYPTTQVTVKFGEQGLNISDKDLIVIASGDHNWLQAWSDVLPAAIAGNSKRFDTSDLVFKSIDWKTPDPRNIENPARTALTYDSTGNVAFIAGFESPVSSGKSVVLISSGKPEGQEIAASALSTPDKARRLQGSLAVIHKDGITPLVNQYSYTIGSLGFWRDLLWKATNLWPNLTSYWWAVILVLLVLTVVLIALLRKIMRRMHHS